MALSGALLGLVILIAVIVLVVLCVVFFAARRKYVRARGDNRVRKDRHLQLKVQIEEAKASGREQAAFAAGRATAAATFGDTNGMAAFNGAQMDPMHAIQPDQMRQALRSAYDCGFQAAMNKRVEQVHEYVQLQLLEEVRSSSRVCCLCVSALVLCVLSCKECVLHYVNSRFPPPTIATQSKSQARLHVLSESLSKPQLLLHGASPAATGAWGEPDVVNNGGMEPEEYGELLSDMVQPMAAATVMSNARPGHPGDVRSPTSYFEAVR
jgi:hypothetical protein